MKTETSAQQIAGTIKNPKIADLYAIDYGGVVVWKDVAEIIYRFDDGSYLVSGPHSGVAVMDEYCVKEAQEVLRDEVAKEIGYKIMADMERLNEF